MNYIEHLLILVFAVAENVSISALASLVDTFISHDEFFPATNALKKYDDLKEAITNPKAISKYV